MVEKIGEGSYALGWTAVGDDGDSGTAAEYDLRISNGPITEDNFYVATRVLNTPIPSIAGTKEHLLMELNTGEYYLCIKVGDEIPNWSPVSNVFKLVVGVFPPINVLWNQ
uniref:Fibronectin type-III domain-containing protein n=1 Tax=viral metagenome TaxID=1070528 RepID=A0A6M3LVC3_9ZZZZ